MARPFRWPKVEQDIALCKEIVNRRPVKGEDWDDIAVSLSTLFTTEQNEIQLKGRGCRERSDLLVKKYQSEERKALKRYVKFIFIRTICWCFFSLSQ